ncbi:microtubule affinity regulating kinase 2 [Phyllostomus discolor]|uniref:non-specific serine/threonine protein kinase n=1 Tax=Phyllostomus discolor TaxID=89673 RepID=A0A7E6CU01_9CHIR|nr:serine/threonine-protein kinase MARK2-like [Phyllostomus discolor]KAF6082052.1 microtubule affinity regulating kinase 2 [Phyllostomus discolor]
MANHFAATFGNKTCLIGDYIPLKSIGKGSFAEIKLARHWLTGTEVAVKSVSKRGLTRRFEEVKSLKTLRHPNITALFEVITTQNKHILFMECASGGDLYDHLEECGRKTEHEARPMFRQMISALHYCHRKNIVHRDLKPENILLDEDLNVKVADFGFSRDFTNYKLTTICGTYAYMAPEILERQKYDGPKADVWSLGVILYRMVTGDELFVGDTAGEVTKEIQSKQLHPPDFISQEVQDLLQKMLTIDPSQRPTLDDIMKDTWVNMGEDEEMRPYSEPPWGDIDPQVAKIMKGMGFKKREIRESLTQKKYDRVMGTYLILRRKTTKMQGCTIKVRPCSSSDSSTTTSCSEEAETPIPSTSTAPSLDSSSSPSPGSKEAGKKDPPPRVEVKMSLSPTPRLLSSSSSTCFSGETVPTTPPTLDARSTNLLLSPVLQRGPGGSPTTHSRRSGRSCQQTSELGGGTLGSPSGSHHGRQGVARRVLRFLLKCLCCRPSTNKNRIMPM